jgi:hypothetical protein
MLKRVRIAAFCAVLISAAALPAAMFAAEDGVYLATTNTYYLNPDTGVTDDGGSRNAAIGEGMCRSVIYEKALVEIDGGAVYVTVRVRLVSNMGAIKFTVQQKPGDPSSYASVSPRIISEDAGEDTADYRFSVPSVTSYIGCSTYVTPMGRDVKFYMNLADSLTEGNADFVVSVKPRAEELAAGDAPDVDSPVVDSPVVERDDEPEVESAVEAVTETSSPEESGGEDAATNEKTVDMTVEDDGGEENVAEEPVTEDTDARGFTDARDGGTDDETEDAAGGFPVIPVAVVSVALVVGATVIVRKNKRG